MVSLRLVSMILLVGACGGAGVRYQALGQGRVVVAGTPAAVGPGASATAGLPAAVAVPADAPDSTYRVDFDVWLPRAAEVDWTIRCGSAAVAGVVGEDFATYQERRLRDVGRHGGRADLGADRGAVDRDRGLGLRRRRLHRRGRGDLADHRLADRRAHRRLTDLATALQGTTAWSRFVWSP